MLLQKREYTIHLERLAADSKETVQVQHEQGFYHTIKSIESKLIESKEKIAELEKKTAPVNPYRQLIRTVTATVEVLVKSDESIDTQFLDRGGYIAFARGGVGLMVMSSTTCFAKQLGNGRVVYRGVFELDATSDATRKPVLFLREAEYIQIGFAPMPEKREIIGGKAICTLNNTVRVEITVPAQVMSKDFIVVRDIKSSFSDFKD